MINNSMKRRSDSSERQRVMPLTTKEWKEDMVEENDAVLVNMKNEESTDLPSQVITKYLNTIGITSSPQIKTAPSDSDSDDDINPYIEDMRRTRNKKIAASFVQQVKSGTTNDGSLIHHSLTMRQPEIVEVVTKRKSMTKGLCCSIL
jgi:hypothetical protein